MTLLELVALYDAARGGDAARATLDAALARATPDEIEAFGHLLDLDLAAAGITLNVEGDQ